MIYVVYEGLPTSDECRLRNILHMILGPRETHCSWSMLRAARNSCCLGVTYRLRKSVSEETYLFVAFLSLFSSSLSSLSSSSSYFIITIRHYIHNGVSEGPSTSENRLTRHIQHTTPRFVRDTPSIPRIARATNYARPMLHDKGIARAESWDLPCCEGNSKTVSRTGINIERRGWKWLKAATF